MVKDEDDIVFDWVTYHGKIFGYRNLHIIDNYSSDNTYNILKQFNGIHLYRSPNYKLKGDYMTMLIHAKCSPHELAFPIDIDEFITYYDSDSNKISCDPDIIKRYIFSLVTTPSSHSTLYKMNYIWTNVFNSGGYARAALDCPSGTYVDYKDVAKSFFHRKFICNKIIDHGNHMHSSHYKLSKLCLIHYHCRNLSQIKKKTFNNVSGLGYRANDRESLEKMGPNCNGWHHVSSQLAFLNNTYKLPLQMPNSSDISITSVGDFLRAAL